MQFNEDWRFCYLGLQDTSFDGSGIDVDDTSWQQVTVPHDWSIRLGFDRERGDGATAYMLGGVGWYRKHFSIERKSPEGKVFIYFDGIYGDCSIYMNGYFVRDHHYGYSPFYIDVSEYLAKKNVLAIKVDHSRYVDSRWYTGSGIYRTVETESVLPVFMKRWNCKITSSVENGIATVTVSSILENSLPKETAVTVSFHIRDRRGTLVHSHVDRLTIESGGKTPLLDICTLERFDYWDIDDPALYDLAISVTAEGGMTDRYRYRFGIRTIRFDQDRGFFLNGKGRKIQGVCLHHDGGLVGAAVPDDVWRRRLRTLKLCGCNAIRSAHNPASTAFLDLCDELGFLVQDEFFDEWENPKDKRLNTGETHSDRLSRGYSRYFPTCAKEDLQDALSCHFNHPSVFQWSIGNEIEWTYPGNREATGFFDAEASGNYFWETPPNSVEKIREIFSALPDNGHSIGRMARKLAGWVRELDATRPVIANCILPSASFESGYADALDIVGFSYRRVMYDYAHTHYPEKVCMGTENLPQYHEWKAIEERPFISGTFLWTGINYLGEAHRFGWPYKARNRGLIDLAGFPEPAYYMYSSLWNDRPVIRLFTQTEEKSTYKAGDGHRALEKEPGSWEHRTWAWPEVNGHWDYEKAEPMIVECYSNCDCVELFCNDRSLGKRYRKDLEDNVFRWSLPFEKGTIRAIGTKAKATVSHELRSTSATASIQLETDPTQAKANGTDCFHVVARLLDQHGNRVRSREEKILFAVTGDVAVLGTDNGGILCDHNYRSLQVDTRNGKALLLLQATEKAGEIVVSASADGIKSNRLDLKTSWQ